MKNKIGIIFSGFFPFYIIPFLEICKKSNIIVDLFVFENNASENEVITQYINKIYKLKTKYNDKEVKIIQKIENEIKNIVNTDDYDYIISDVLGLSFTCNIFHYATLSHKINLSDNIVYKIILTIGHFKRLKYERNFYKNCKKIFVVSDYLKNDYIKNCNLDSNKISVIHPGVCNSHLKAHTKTENKIFTFGSVTCGFTNKGGYNILGALRKFIKTYPDKKIKIKFINPKYNKQILLKLYIKLYKLENYVEFLPFTNDINEFYNSLDTLICASRYEAFGRVVTEAITCNIPVLIGSNIGACDIIKDNISGFIFNADKNIYQNLADKMSEVISKQDKFEEITKKAKDSVQNLTWQNFARQLFYNLFSTM